MEESDAKRHNRWMNNPEDPTTSTEYYDSLSGQYEEWVFCESMEYKAYKYVAGAVSEILGKRKDAHILDVAAGTGLIGLELRKLGFENIDAVDASANMLSIARQRGCYKKIMISMVTEQPIEGVDPSTYDVLCAAGWFGAQHIKREGFVELTRILKKGGFFVFSHNTHEAVTKDLEELESVLQDYYDKGILRQLSCRSYPDFKKGWPGNVYCVQRM